MIRTLLFALSLLTAVAGGALAQDTQSPPNTSTPNTPTDASAVDALVMEVTILTRTPTLTAVPENEPLPVNLSLVDVPGASAELTQGVTAKAYTRYVTVDGEKIGQMVLTAVEKGGKTEALSPNDFTAQFALSKPELDPSSPIEVKGNREALVAALRKLAEPEAAAETEPDKAPAKQADMGASKNQTGSNASRNNEAASYQTPDALPVAESAPPVVKVTTEGCPIRVDEAQGDAIQQNRVETTADGNVSSTACEDGDQRFPLHRSYSACSYDENIESLKASAQFIYYYTDGGGNRQEIGDCRPDPEKVYDIVEDRNACPVYLDYGKSEAVPQAKLVYVNHNNRKKTVEDCAPSREVAPAPMVPTTEGCEIRDDFSTGKSYRRSKYVYTLEGHDWATACADDGTEYPHKKVYKTANDDKVCETIVNRESNTATLQSRIQITVNELPRFITPCTPDTSSLTVKATINGCENPANWHHYLSAVSSYGQQRFYYMLDGKPEYVSDCQDSQQTFPHNYETTGWQRHDDKLFAYRLTTVYIEGTPMGRYNILTSEVLPGAEQQPYVYEGESTALSGDVWYEDCSRYEGRNVMNNYTRPDSSQYQQPVGPATPAGPVNACVGAGGNTPTEWAVGTSYQTTKSTYCASRNTSPCELLRTRYTWKCPYRATRTLTREDGVVVSTRNATKSKSFSADLLFLNPEPYTCTGSSYKPTQTDVNVWKSELGWTF